MVGRRGGRGRTRTRSSTAAEEIGEQLLLILERRNLGGLVRVRVGGRRESNGDGTICRVHLGRVCARRRATLGEHGDDESMVDERNGVCDGGGAVAVMV